MTAADTSSFFTTQATRDVPRDRYGRYLLPDSSGKNTGWTRATTFAATLAESYGLRIWEQRQVVWGLSRRPDLLTLASTITGPEDKKALGEIVDAAHEAGATKAKANRGTAIHAACQAVEINGPHHPVPDELRNDVFGYFAEIAEKRLTILPEFVERTGICPEFGVAGTFDNLVRCPDGKLRILDKKTGNLDYAEIEFAVQMALYAHFTALRNYNTNMYEPMPEVAKDYAIIAHILPGTGKTVLYRINIRWGWAWAATCAEVQDIRKTKHVLTPYIVDDATYSTAVPNPPRTLLASDPWGRPPYTAAELAQMDAHVGEQFDQAVREGFHGTVPTVGQLQQNSVSVPDDFWNQPDEDDAPPFVATPGVQGVALGSAPAAPSAAKGSPPFTSATTAAAAPATPSPVAGPAPGVSAAESAGSDAFAAGFMQSVQASPPFTPAGPDAHATPSAVPLAPSMDPTTEPTVDPETAAEELVKACKGKAKLQSIAKTVMDLAGVGADAIKLSQHQIKIARAVVALCAEHAIPVPMPESAPRRASDGPTKAEQQADKALNDTLKYVRSMPSTQGLIEYKARLAEQWADEHEEAARVRVEEIKQLTVGEQPLSPAEIIAGATSPQTLQIAWRNATGNGANTDGWTPELDAAAKAKAAELGSSVPVG